MQEMTTLFPRCPIIATREAIVMRGTTRDLWKAGIAMAGMLLLLLLMAWIPVSAAGAEVRGRGVATPVTVQATPTVDATVTALNKEKLEQEVQQLKEQNEPDFFGWLRASASILLSTLVVVSGGLIGLWRWRRDRRDAQDKELEDREAERERRDEEQKRWLKDQEAERERRVEERFQTVVEGLGSEREEAKVGAAITLRTFLRPGYEEFYTQAFDLAVAHLRLPRAPHQLEDPNTSLPLTTLSQALIVVFKEVFPLARSQNKGSPQSLDASYIQLDNAYLVGADLEEVWMTEASCREAYLSHANLSRANLFRADLSGAKLSGADLSDANLFRADLSETDLSQANLSQADLSGAKLSRAKLSRAKLRQADLSEADLSEAALSEADLRWADLSEADLSEAELILARLSEADLSEADLSEAELGWADFSQADLRGANLRGARLSLNDLRGADLRGADLRGADLGFVKIEDAQSLEDTDLRGVKGLTKEQLEAYKARGAIIDEDTTTSSPQPTVAPPTSPQSSDGQAPAAPAAQGSTPTPETDESSAASSKPGPES